MLIMKDPLVSILIPCYNHELFLEDCIHGILEQDYSNIEVIICDDASTDRSYDILCSLMDLLKEKYERVEILRNAVNGGVTKSLNKMLKMAKGDLIKDIASDDVMTSDAISKMVQAFEANLNIDVVVSNGVTISQFQHYPDYILGERWYRTPPDFEQDDLFRCIYKANYIFAPGVMVKKTLYERYGDYDEDILIEDLEFWLRILRDGKVRFKYLDDVLIYYRINDNSMTSSVKNADLEMRRKRFHLSIIQILNKYHADAGDQLYARTLLCHMFDEKGVAIRNELYEWEAFVDNELREFSYWDCVDFRNKVYFGLRYIKLALEKILLRFKNKKERGVQ